MSVGSFALILGILLGLSALIGVGPMTVDDKTLLIVLVCGLFGVLLNGVPVPVPFRFHAPPAPPAG